MKAKEMIWICMFILLAVGVMAVQPQIAVPTAPSALTVVYPKTECIKMVEDSYFNFDVLDANYSKLTNVTATCAYYVANQQGTLIVSGSPTYDDTYQFWNFLLNHTLITEENTYNFYIYCNKTASENGFVSLTYQLTKQGVCGADDKSPITALILVPLLFGILLLIGSFMFGEDHAILKIALFLISYLTIFISLWFGVQSLVKYYGFADLQEVIGTTVWIFGIIFFVILSYFLVYAFIQGVEAAAQKKRKEMEY